MILSKRGGNSDGIATHSPILWRASIVWSSLDRLQYRTSITVSVKPVSATIPIVCRGPDFQSLPIKCVNSRTYAVNTPTDITSLGATPSFPHGRYRVFRFDDTAQIPIIKNTSEKVILTDDILRSYQARRQAGFFLGCCPSLLL